VPVATDGRNISIYDGGAELNDKLLVLKLPWVQFYWGALSLALFGDDTAGLRALFALAGLLALFPLWSVLRGRLPSPLLLATAMLLAPQVLLFQRNARYFPLLTIEYALVVWLVATPGRPRRQRLLLGCAVFVLMFHTHPLAAATCSLALLLLRALQRSRLF